MIRNLFAALAAVLLLGNAAVFAAPAPYPAPADERSEREADLYEQGEEAIDAEKWEKALRIFAGVAEMKGTRADGAVFWSAYALNKLNRRAEALKTIDGLKKAYPKSRWLDDANALELELRQARGERVAPEHVDDEDLKVMAINSLMHTDPEKAYPLLEKVLHGNSSKKIKERAIFILSQSGSPRSQALLGEIARGNSNPDLQKTAVRYLGISGSAQSRKILGELYSQASSRSVKKEVLQAYMISGDKEHVLSAARGEKDLELRKDAIKLLGIMGARGELASMYASEPSRDVKEEIIQGLFLSGDIERIGELARAEKDPALRKEAIQKLGLMGGKTAPTLAALYASESDPDVKEAVINAYFLQGNARALIDLSKKEKNKQLRNEAIQKLSLMNDDEALQYMLEILNEN